MLNALSAKLRVLQELSASAARDAPDRPAVEPVPQVASAATESPPVAHDALPLIVTKAEEEVRSRLALKRMGYFRVLLAYVRFRWARSETFFGLGAQHLWPSTQFVGDWLKQERGRLVAQHRSVFLLALVATLVAGLSFVGALVVLG
jgi:hypothetical protein